MMTARDVRELVRIMLILWAVVAVLFLSGCIYKMAPEAQTEIAKRQVSLRAVGIVSFNPMSGMVICSPCWVSLDRNLGQGPEPPDGR